jgi:glycosyltransferase involved in cell wall biosynthesis
MHVLYLIDSLVPGGAERSLAALAPAYASRSVRLDVAYLHDRPGLQDELRGAGAALFCLAGPGGRVGWVGRAGALMRRRAPDLVHTTLLESDIVGRLAARRSGVPVVTSLVNPQYGPEHLRHPGFAPWKVRLGRLVDRGTARWVARFHAISRYIAGVMGSTLGIAPHRIDVIPRGREPRSLGIRSPGRRIEARRRLGITDGEILLLAVARQDRQKGLDVLLDALPAILRRVPRARLLVAGRTGNATGLLQARALRSAFGDAARFIGMREDVPDLLCAADVFLLPSRWEGLGSVLLEAMALETPIVASDLPAVREVVEHERSALLVPVEDAPALAEAVALTVHEPRAAGDRAAAARARFEDRFTIDNVADQMVAFYERALGTAG